MSRSAYAGRVKAVSNSSCMVRPRYQGGARQTASAESFLRAVFADVVPLPAMVRSGESVSAPITMPVGCTILQVIHQRSITANQSHLPDASTAVMRTVEISFDGGAWQPLGGGDFTGGIQPIPASRGGGELFNSAQTCLVAMLITIIAAMVLAYLSRIPIFEPLVSLLTRFRFLSLIGISFVRSVSLAA